MPMPSIAGGWDGPRAAGGLTEQELTALELRKVSLEFEAMFFEMLLKEMNATESGSPFGGTGSQGDTYRSMIEHELSTKLAETGSLGIADVLYRQMAPRAGIEPSSASPQKAGAAYRHVRDLAPVDPEEPLVVPPRRSW